MGRNDRNGTRPFGSGQWRDELNLAITCWREPDGVYLRCLNGHSEHWTQGTDLEGLKERLRDLDGRESVERNRAEQTPRIAGR